MRVVWSRRVQKELECLPTYIRDKFIAWVMVVERIGLREVRRISGYHDEPLKGDRIGQRSIRLNRAYRAIYVELDSGEIHFIEVVEVSNHGY